MRRVNSKLAKFLLRSPIDGIAIFEKRLNQITQEMVETAGGEKLLAAQAATSFPKQKTKLKMNLSGNVGRNFVTPRGLKAHLIN